MPSDKYTHVHRGIEIKILFLIKLLKKELYNNVI